MNVMAWYLTIVERIDDAANAWLPPDYHFGYELAHDSRLRPDDPTLADAAEDADTLDEGCAEILTRWRERLTRYAARGDVGAADDLAALPAAGRYLLVGIIHRPTGIRAVRTYSYATIRDLITNPNLTNQQKRNQIRQALGNLFQTAQERVAAAT
jgi:hypothetical protein